MPGPSSNQNLGVQIIPAEVAKNPPPAYENVVSTDQGKGFKGSESTWL